jgi:ATP-dependent helicase/nuclease subunit B
VMDGVAQELSRIKIMRPETFAPRFIAIEQQRMTGLMLEWLQLERQRAPFKAISLEQKETVNLTGLELDVVADRIDQLEDGTSLIIDYKTGKEVSPKGWFEQRIGEPQLPLYATTNSAAISGVLLAGVSRANLGFKGVVRHADLVPKDRNRDCLYCPLPMLCRIHEREDADVPGDLE